MNSIQFNNSSLQQSYFATTKTTAEKSPLNYSFNNLPIQPNTLNTFKGNQNLVEFTLNP
jgi:hypothetical protein